MSGAVACVHSIEGEGPTVILVHGIGSRRATWQGLIARLRDAFRCVSYDLRGHGDSPVPPTPYSLDDLVADLEALRARRPEHLDLTHAGDASQHVLDLRVDVVAEVDLVEPAIRRDEVHHQDDGRGLLLGRDAFTLHLFGQLGLGPPRRDR